MLLRVAVFVLLVSVVFMPCVRAADVLGDVVVEVKSVAKEAPISGATVRLQDIQRARPAQTATTDAEGRARFTGLLIGQYSVDITHPDFESDRATVQVQANAAATCRTMLDEKGKEQVIKVRADRILVNPHNPVGNTQPRNTTFMGEQTGNDTFQGVISTTPGVQTNSLGQFHPRGEHKGVSVSVDGINVPLPTEDATSQLVDPRFLDSLDVQTGYFDASAGGQLGAVVSLVTKQGPQDPYFEFIPKAGTFGTYEGLVRAGGSNKKGDFNWFAGAAYGETDNRLEPPQPGTQTANNHGRDVSALIRLNKRTEDDTLGLTLSVQNGKYGVPQTADNFAAGVRQTQQNTNMFGVFSWRRKMSDNADFLLGLAYLQSRISVTNNGVFTPWTTVPASLSPDLNSAGLPLDPQNPGSPYLPTTDLSIRQIQPTVEFNWRFSDDHRFKVGATADFIQSHQNVNIVDAGGGGGLPNPTGAAVPPSAFNTVVDRNGFLGGDYFSHTFPIKDRIFVNYGLRGDFFDNGSNIRTGQLSPRINVAIPTSDTSALRFSYNQIFQAPPLEIDPTGNTFVLPQKTNQYEVSYDFQPARAIVGRVAAVYKQYHDQVDVALLVPNSNIPVFAPTNFGRGYYKGVEFSLTSQYPTGWNGFLSTTVGVARPTAPGPFDPDVPAYNDHDQRVQVAFGASYAWKNGLVAAFDGLYGSGFPNDPIAQYNAIGVNPFGLVGSRFGRFIGNLNINWYPRDAEGNKKKNGVGFGLTVQNIFDNRQVLNFLSGFSGTRFVQGRRVLLNGLFRW